MLMEAKAAFGVAATQPVSPGSADTQQQGAQGENDDSDNDDVGESDVYISGATGKLRVSTPMHHLYLRRCDKDDTTHPYHDMCIVVRTGLVRVEACAPSKAPKSPACRDSDDGSDDEPDGEDIEDCCDNDAPNAHAKKRGRRRADRYGFVGRSTSSRYAPIIIV